MSAESANETFRYRVIPRARGTAETKGAGGSLRRDVGLVHVGISVSFAVGPKNDPSQLPVNL